VYERYLKRIMLIEQKELIALALHEFWRVPDGSEGGPAGAMVPPQIQEKKKKRLYFILFYFF
jgi:hypothetical protein